VSRDLFVQDIPEGVRGIDEIPDDWMPRPLPFGTDAAVEAVLAAAPNADVSDSERIHVALPGVDVEVNCGRETPLQSFALHVRATDQDAANTFIRALLTRLGARAFDPESETGIFPE
jgi:hypothetical protein